MMSQPSPLLILRRNKDLQLRYGSAPYDKMKIIGEESETIKVKAIDVSDDGKYLAYADTTNSVKVVTLPNIEIVFETKIGVNYLKLSPKANVIALWQHTTQNVQNNLKLYNVFSGTLLTEMMQRQQSRWCPHWTPDETICVRHLNMELHFYENNQFEQYTKKLFAQKVTNYSMVTHRQTGKHYIACYSTGTKGQPNFVRVYEYPKFDGLGLANKSFYKADSVDFKWNYKGDALLLYCSFDVDQSGKSYYGEQALHYLDIKGDTCIVKLNKNGPIHNTSWIPSMKESLFCVVYGFMPAKASMFNTKSEIVFEFGESMVNLISFNPHGNLMALAGFGNLRGGVSVWDLKRRKVLSEFKSPETTHIEWCADGMHIMTATTSPRLRVGNGFRIWYYNGTKIHEEIFDVDTELYDIIWQPFQPFPEPVIKDIPIPKTLSKQSEPPKYVPPHLRKLGTSGTLGTVQNNVKSQANPLTEREKKMKNLEKKLQQIQSLKQMMESGKSLEKNQMEKIEKEHEIIDELANLQLNL